MGKKLGVFLFVEKAQIKAKDNGYEALYFYYDMC